MLRKCIIILIAFPAYTLFFSNLAFASAKIKIPFDSWNFGDVSKGDVLSHDFEIYNAGKSALNISDIRTSCGCTAVVLFSESVASGKMGIVNVKFDSSVMNAGKFEKYITIYSNALRKPRVRLTVSGVVIASPMPKIKIYDQLKDLGVFFPEQSKDFNVTLTNEGESILQLEAVTSKEYVSINIAIAGIILKPGEKKKLPFTFVPPVKYGAFSMLFAIISNDPMRPEEYVRLKGYVTNQKAVMIYKNNVTTLVVNGLGKDIFVQKDAEKEERLKTAKSLTVEGKNAKIILRFISIN